MKCKIQITQIKKVFILISLLHLPWNAPLVSAGHCQADERFRSVFVRIPSQSAGTDGIAATVLIPQTPRYTNSAPVAIIVPGGMMAGSARGKPEYVFDGFIEIHFAFPGGGAGDERSGGTYDYRGQNCVGALADVIKFATGRIRNKSGKYIQEVTAPVVPLTNNVGLVGESNGGNACGLAMAKYGEEFPRLAWYVSMESPYGEGAVNIELGGHNNGLNPAYDSATGKIDYSTLTFGQEFAPPFLCSAGNYFKTQLKGALYFDLNKNGEYDPSTDFVVNCIICNIGSGVKAWYSPRILAEAYKRNLIPQPAPSHIPTVEESRNFWLWRDGSYSLPEIGKKLPDLAVIVYANERDHVQAHPMHSHIIEQVEGFRKAGVRFVRLNPDRSYVLIMLPQEFKDNQSIEFPDYPAGTVWGKHNITDGLEPSILPAPVYMHAAVCELADRKQSNNWTPNLDAVIYPDIQKYLPQRPLPGKTIRVPIFPLQR